ncbi:MAG: hypothetical protein NC548_16020 [Lachnospiraceae bacterium]|nr:hypothetical protein [Lachnospiraceae bacterium]
MVRAGSRGRGNGKLHVGKAAGQDPAVSSSAGLSGTGAGKTPVPEEDASVGNGLSLTIGSKVRFYGSGFITSLLLRIT